MKKCVLIGVMVVIALVAFAGCSAEGEKEFPSKQINIHVPYGVGGNLDLKARLVAKYLEEESGVPVVIVNKPGAGGIVGTTEFLQKPASAYEVIFLADNGYCLAPLVSNVAYEIDDVTPIVGFDVEQGALFSNPKKTGIATIEDLIEYGKTQKVVFSSGGPTTSQYLIVKALLNKYGIEGETLQHANQPEGFTNIMGGHSDVMLGGQAAAEQYVESGDMVPLMNFSDDGWVDYAGMDVPSARSLGEDFFWESFTFFGVKAGADEQESKKLEELFLNVYSNELFLKELEKFEPILRTLNTAETQEVLKTSEIILQQLVEDAK